MASLVLAFIARIAGEASFGEDGCKMKSEKLMDKIRQAFNQSQPPSITDPAPYGEGWEETCDFWGKSWQELTLKDFHNNSGCFFYLGDQNFPYFFGALMFHMLRDNALHNNVFDSLIGLWRPFEKEELEFILEADEFGPEFLKEGDKIVSDLTKQLKRVLSERQKGLIRDFLMVRWSQLDDVDVVEEKGFLAAVDLRPKYPPV